MLFHHETDSERLDRLKLLLVVSEASYAHMKRVNDYYRDHGTTQGCPGVALDAVKIIDDGIKSGEFPDGLPFSAHDVMHDYYEIQRLKGEVVELESRMDKFVGWTFAGGEAIVSAEVNRLQLKFAGDVSTVKRFLLKLHGFSWSQFDNVWERRLEREAILAAAHIRFVHPKDGTSPEKIQPYSKEAERQNQRK